jgi:hypothetical protein
VDSVFRAATGRMKWEKQLLRLVNCQGSKFPDGIWISASI